tara:strand:- start:77 stop:235 length:159 start_codon:yes stop_codon:yes gene_type:complete
MNAKKTVQKEVESTLKALQQKIDHIKEKVDKLCESTECFESIPPGRRESKKK